MEIFPTVAKNTLVQIFGRAVVIGLTLLATALLTRLLGVSGYGHYVFIMTLVMFFVALADWGTGLISVRETVKKEIAEEKFFGNAFLFRFFLALVAFVIFNLLAFFWPTFQFLSLALKIASFLILVLSLKTSCHIIFQTRLRFEYLALTDMVTSFVFLAILLSLFLVLGWGATLEAVMLVFGLASFLGTLLAVFLAKQMADFDFRLNGKIIQKIVQEAFPTGALLLIFSVYNRLDIFLLQFLKGAEPVGIYGLAYKVHDNLILGAAYLTASLFPLISAMANKSQEESKLGVVYRKTFDLLLLGGLVILLGVFLLAPLIIFLVGGVGFSKSTVALRILVFATFLAYFNHLTGYTLIALGRQRVSLLVALLALFFNLSLNFILIPHYSYLGAAVVTIATEGLVLILTGFYLAKNFSLRPGLTFHQTLIEAVKTRGKIF